MRTGPLPAVCAVLCILTAWPARAGDEIDYSAPYLVVEDGKLVTKYPGREHDPQAGAGPDTAAGTDDAGTGAGSVPAPAARGQWFVGLVAVTVLAALFLAWRRRQA